MSALLKPCSAGVDLASPQTAAAALRTFFRLAEAWQLGDRRADHAARRRPHHALPVEAGQGRAARPASARAAVAPVRHLLVAAHPLSGRPRAPTSGCASPTPRRSSPAARRSTACSAARSPISGSCASTSTPSAAARPDRRRSQARIAPWPSIRQACRRARVSWRPSYRLIPSRYPTVGLYDAIADPADLDVVFAIEALANPRLRDEIGELQLVPPEERVTGPGATPVMAAFTHLNPEGSRFSDGSYGVYYAAHSLETSVAEVSHHRAIFLRRTDEPAIDLDMRLDHRQRRGRAARPRLGRRRRARRTNRFAAVARPRRLRPVAAARPRLARGRQLGHALAERARRRRRVRRHLPAARLAPCQGGGAHRPALGRRSASRTGSRSKRRTSSAAEIFSRRGAASPSSRTGASSAASQSAAQAGVHRRGLDDGAARRDQPVEALARRQRCRARRPSASPAQTAAMAPSAARDRRRGRRPGSRAQHARLVELDARRERARRRRTRRSRRR